MKRFLNLSFLYAILAMVSGVFYREFTKINGFTEKTTLSVLHTHLFLLGMVVFLLLMLVQFHVDFIGHKRFKLFFIVYNAGVVLSMIMMIVRGVVQVLGTPLSKGLDAAISGMSGIGHIALSVGFIIMFLNLRSLIKDKE